MDSAAVPVAERMGSELMGVPQVVIVGRPNVGKSSLFNWLVGMRVAIVDPTAGVTRDRVSQIVDFDGRFVELTDTGGMGIRDTDNLTEHIERQIKTAIDGADLVLFVVDTRDGLLPLDEVVARRLRPLSVPVILVANKADAPSIELQAEEFHRFGFDVVPVSTRENRGRAALVECLLARLPAEGAEGAEAPREPTVKLAIVGRRNVGKSTFINTLVRQERMIVSEVPGTTRDSVDVRFELDGHAFLAIDTPGFRRTKSVSTDVDYYGMHRAQRSIRRADVVLLFFDAAVEIGKVDLKVADYIVGQFKPCLFVVNKWDLVAEKTTTQQWADYLRAAFPMMPFATIAFITSRTGKNVKRLLNHAQMLFKQARSRVPTAELNRLIRAALEQNPPPLHKHRRVKVYYATQVAVSPPTIVLFCNMPHALSSSYRRYLTNVLRDHCPFAEVPIRLHVRKREQTDTTDAIESRLKSR